MATKKQHATKLLLHHLGEKWWELSVLCHESFVVAFYSETGSLGCFMAPKLHLQKVDLNIKFLQMVSLDGRTSQTFPRVLKPSHLQILQFVGLSPNSFLADFPNGCERNLDPTVQRRFWVPGTWTFGWSKQPRRRWPTSPFNAHGTQEGTPFRYGFHMSRSTENWLKNG